MTFIVAEISGNHNGSLERAKQHIYMAAMSGCDAVKIQTYEPAELCDPDNNDIYEKSKIPIDWFPELFRSAKRNNIPLFSSVFSVRAVEFLEAFNCPYYKIASPESTRLPEHTYRELARTIHHTGKMFLASSGKQDMDFVRSLHPHVLFYCKAGYPAIIHDDDLEYMALMRTWPECAIGFSDHTDNLKSPLAMIGAGARYIEKHFKLDDNCLDASFSFDPEQMAKLCRVAK